MGRKLVTYFSFLIAAAMLVTVFARIATAVDVMPPQLTEFSLSPKIIDTSSSDQTVTLTVTVKDDMAGFSASNEDVYPLINGGSHAKLAAGSQHVHFKSFTLKSGNAFNGTYESTAIIARGSEPGDWAIQEVYLSDRAGNSRIVNKDLLDARFGAGATTINNSGTAADTTAPQITAFSLSPKIIDTSSADQTVTLTVTVTDDMAGFCTGGNCQNDTSISHVGFRTEGGIVEFEHFSLISGDALNGTYEATVVMARGSATGEWKVSGGTFWDRVGNAVSFTADELEAKFGAGAATITNSGITADTTAPQITAFSLSPKIIDTSSADQTVTLTVTVTDDMAGFFTGNTCHGMLSSPLLMLMTKCEFLDCRYVDFRNFTLKSGDALNGTYEATAVIARGSAAGSWKVAYSIFTDRVCNGINLNADELEAKFGAGAASIMNVADTTVLYTYYESAGIWNWNGLTWTQINTGNTTGMTASGRASGSNVYANFSGYGLWKWNGSTWRQLNPVEATGMTVSGMNLYVNFAGYGLWLWDEIMWSQINPTEAAVMVASGSDLYANFTGYGIWKWNGTGWSQLNPTEATAMTASGTNLYANFAGYGIWQWNGSTWSQINPGEGTSMTASGTNLYANFAGYGLWQWNGSAWTRINPGEGANLTASGANLYANFAGYGLWKWNGSKWTQINTGEPAIMVGGE